MGLCGNCTAWQDKKEQMYQADPDIAGIGVSVDVLQLSTIDVLHL